MSSSPLYARVYRAQQSSSLRAYEEIEPHPFRWGFLGNYIQNDFLDVERNNAVVRQTVINSSMGELTASYKRLGFQAVAGVSTIFAETALSSLFSGGTPRNGTLSLNFTTGFSWALGATMDFFEYKKWSFGGGASYFAHYSELSSIVDQKTSITYYFDDFRTTYSSWSISLALDYLAQITKQFAVKPQMVAIYGPSLLSLEERTVVLDPDTQILVSNLSAPPTWGYALGINLIARSQLSLTVEIVRIAAVGYGINLTLPF